eukprot:CAMPEP_0172576516 /NCGR_PEP_ID=MMETSP1067-20121228/137767_1 /TAXON_ID=265564 ORGANISM="Thalassiosira punctigera, Strain Tpunct2005C2" /NCGR_SAMPLE_ID=MMETSP1067 /ASSEMBLY_ACC=CAM_ASM_000444 /LENGTH=392 /DNA_ID=CAMNT_0013369191 /DNA_START=1 /DNA_END=1179 /DNA_ORIENTATION=+
MAQSIALLINARDHKNDHRSARGDPHGDDGSGERGDNEGGGTMAFACHPTSHLLLHENDAFNELLGMDAVVVDPNPDSTKEIKPKYDPRALKDNGCYGMEPMRLSHVRNSFSALDDGSEATLTYPNGKRVGRADVSTLVLELPHREAGGKLTPWEEVEEISRLCHERGVRFHCDGARIFEASAGYGHESAKRTAEPFASVYVSFYKGLGAISGAMLLGDVAFCAEARVWLRRMGGNLYTVLPYAVSSWDGFRKRCLEEEGGERAYDNSVFENRRRKLARVLNLLSADAKIMSVVRFDPVVPETNVVHGYLRMSYDECMTASEKVEKSTGIRVLSRVRGIGDGGDDSKSGDDAEGRNFGCRFEWTMGESNSLIEDNQFVFGWKKFAEVTTKEE